MPVLIGADPEFFLKEKRTRRNISAHGLVPGTKAKPHKLDGGAIQLDGTAVEFNIDPAKTRAEFNENVKKVLAQVRKIVPDKYDFNFSPSVKYGPKYFETIPDDCKELGCNPDHDAYRDGALNPIPEAVGTMRTGAGHIHIGYTNDAKVNDPSHLTDCMILVQNMDALLRPIEHLWDKDTQRRKMYGKYGAFRPKPYGVEYRALSNAWVKDPDLYSFIYDISRYAYNMAECGIVLSSKLPDERMGARTYNRFIDGLLGPAGGIKPQLPEKFIGVH